MEIINLILKNIYKYFDEVLNDSIADARKNLFETLTIDSYTEAQFCNEILDHSTVLKYDADQWFDFLTKVPNKILLSDARILGKLTPRHKLALGLYMH